MIRSDQIIRSVVSNSLRLHESQQNVNITFIYIGKSENSWLTLLQYLLYCGGLESNPWHFRVLSVYPQEQWFWYSFRVIKNYEYGHHYRLCVYLWKNQKIHMEVWCLLKEIYNTKILKLNNYKYTHLNCTMCFICTYVYIYTHVLKLCFIFQLFIWVKRRTLSSFRRFLML